MTALLRRPKRNKIGTVAEKIRNDIIKGKYPAGSRLPTRRELEEKLGAGRVTVQRALDILQKDGFAVPRGCHGTFVVDNPPHLHRYALVLCEHPEHGEATLNFPRRISTVAKELGNTEAYEFIQFKMSGGPQAIDDYKALFEGIEREKYAGIIMVHADFPFSGTPLEAPYCPPVVNIDIGPGSCTIRFDQQEFLEISLKSLADKECKRIAFLHNGTARSYRQFLEPFKPLLEKYELTTAPHWVQACSPYDPDWSCNTMLLMMHEGQCERPDGLVIMDDNLTEWALEGVLRSGVSIPHGLQVVTHTNFPAPPLKCKGIIQIGCDVDALLKMAVGFIERMKKGENVPETVTFSPIVHTVPVD